MSGFSDAQVEAAKEALRALQIVQWKSEFILDKEARAALNAAIPETQERLLAAEGIVEAARELLAADENAPIPGAMSGQMVRYLRAQDALAAALARYDATQQKGNQS